VFINRDNTGVVMTSLAVQSVADRGDPKRRGQRACPVWTRPQATTLIHTVSVLLASLTLLAAAAPPAQAAKPPAVEAESLHVSINDLDLDSREGQAQARLQLSAAASRLCHRLVGTRHFEWQQSMADCISDALTPALAELDRISRARSVALAAESEPSRESK
jgi:UrcA family protein